MQWYYAEGTERKGPFSDEDFQGLVNQGVVTRQTLVWREGMANWEPYSGPTLPAAVSNAAPGQSVICTGCGGLFPRSEVVPLTHGLYCAACKAAALQKLREGVASATAAEDVRRQYLKHEASVKSIGFLYYLGAVFFLLGGVAGIALSGLSGMKVLSGLVLLGLGAVQLTMGIGLRRLKKWARLPAGILSGIGLLAIPIGTIINAYILYLLCSSKGRMVFSDEYREVIDQTPHIKYRTSIVVWIAVIVLFAIFGLAIFGFLAGRTVPR